MKKIIYSATLFACVFFNQLNAQVDAKILNWYNGKYPGMQTEKAYKKLKGKSTKTVIVAVIDSGIDIEHEDLKDKIWKNEKEIPNNGIDDDNNGYVDDIHGWNFLGNALGQHQNATMLEKTRIYKDLKAKYENIESSEVPNSDKEEYALYQKVANEISEERAQYEQALAQMDQMPMIMQMIPDMVKSAIGKSDYTMKDLEKWKPKNDQEVGIRQFAMALKSGEFTMEVVEEQKASINSTLNSHLNFELDDRAFIGDNPHDFNDKKYGNNDVEGPDALHGTHVGGIIGATRGNNLGGDGVAHDIKLMSLRAVPDGDEQDKDIALAIRYAVDNGASVINMSFGKAYSPHQKEVFEALRYADSKGVLLVHAAGNDGANVDVTDNFPTSMYSFQQAKLDHYLTIGASTRNAKGMLAANFSNYGETKVDVFAPGFEIYNSVPQSEYKKLQGTSMAAPMVAGAAAFLKSYFPDMSMKEIKDVLLSTAKSYKGTKQAKPGADEQVDFATLSVTGAVIDLDAAVKHCLSKAK